MSLHAFVQIAKDGNATQAAKRLNVTQPALSQKIRKLQDELDVILLERTPRGMRLTEAGRHFLPAAQKAVIAFNDCKLTLAHLKQDVQGELKIGTIVDPEFLRLGALLRLLAQHYPCIRYELQHGMSGHMLQKIEQGQLDVSYTLGFPGLLEYQHNFNVLPLADFTYRVIAPPGWSQQVKGKDWPDLAALPWIGTPPESAHSRLLERVFQERLLQPNIVAWVDIEASMIDLVKSGVALALARDSLALRAAHEEGVIIADQVSVAATLGFLCRKNRAHEGPIAAAMQQIQMAWNLL